LYAFARDAAGNVSSPVSAGIKLIFGDSSGEAGKNNGQPTLVDALDALTTSVGDKIPSADELVCADIAPIINGLPQPDGKVDI
jgi:hypothetical protein